MAGGSTPQDRDPWAPPQDVSLAKAGDTPPDLHDRQTVTSVPLVPGPQTPPPPQPAPGPYAAPPAPGPYAPPAAPREQGPVPPPPLAPDGPGLPPYGAQPGPQYGYPGPQYGYPGPQYGYPGPQAPQHPQQYGYWPGALPAQPSNGLGIAGMVLGIVAAVLFLMWPIALICGVLGIIFGAMGRARVRRGEATNPGQALTGIICGAAGAALAVGFVVLVVASS
ncbi:DUF4190 domain-containing protein [Streptomyces sp. NPDC088785]|uniref:DUF4190 domain-containing protein n=1 Tax=Streptomyces sp. NPDC088785 TaxID=3365897 RepID=UPI0038204F0A